MSRRLFQQTVDQLFEKLAWPFEPAQVAETVRATGGGDTAADILRGQKVLETAESLGHAGTRAAKAVGRGVSWALQPAHAEGQALGRELGRLGTRVSQSPGLMRMGAGGLLLAPIMMGALHGTQQKREDELMNLQMNPARGFDKLSNSDLDSFLEKKAGARSDFLREARKKMLWMSDPSLIGPGVRATTVKSLVEGVGQGLGGGVAKLLFSGLGAGADALYTSLIVDPKRRKLFESVVRTDPVIHDAVARNPASTQALTEAFQTMVRFAPSLSLDVNAVRSFLREAVVGGVSGVNYATIKSLIETEKAHSKSEDKRP